MEQLHIYAQPQWHDEAYIVGERDRLEALRAAITEALDSVSGRGKVQAFCSDGEGYDIHVIRVTEGQADKLGVPYIENAADADQPGVLWPWNM